MKELKNSFQKLLKSRKFIYFLFIKTGVKIALLLFFLNSCMTYEDVQFRGVDNFKVEGFDKEKVKLKFDARVYNPNDYNITVRAHNIDLGVSGKSLAKASLTKKVVVKKNATDSYPVEIVVKLKDLLDGLGSSVLNLFTSQSVNLEITGNAKVSAKGLSKKFPIDFDFPVDLNELNLFK